MRSCIGNAKTDIAELHKTALDTGMGTLLEDAVEKVWQGLTSAEEVERIAAEI
jgi:type II secretory ATPase GspE/PulE/Tfp pilus assembly ATPase PilB-like protein